MNVLYTILSLTVLTQKNSVADFLAAKCDFTAKTAVLRSELFLWGLGQRMFILGSLESTQWVAAVDYFLLVLLTFC